jgi:hypothetical protein
MFCKNTFCDTLDEGISYPNHSIESQELGLQFMFSKFFYGGAPRGRKLKKNGKNTFFDLLRRSIRKMPLKEKFHSGSTDPTKKTVSKYLVSFLRYGHLKVGNKCIATCHIITIKV